MSNIERIIIGLLGGLSAVLVKFLGQDYDIVVKQAADLTQQQLLSFKVGYGLLTPILMFLGAFVAWISDENKRVKLAALAIAAPAMITTWSGGTKPEVSISMDFEVSSAYAQSSESEPVFGEPIKHEEKPDKTTLEKVKDGIGIFFGYGKERKRYWVIVGSYKSKKDAQQFAKQINAEDATLEAWVGIRVAPNPYYPVIVGDYSFLSDAKALKTKALATESVKDAYLSPGAKR